MPLSLAVAAVYEMVMEEVYCHCLRQVEHFQMYSEVHPVLFIFGERPDVQLPQETEGLNSDDSADW